MTTKKSRSSSRTRKTPHAYTRFGDSHPEVIAKYEALGRACTNAGPLDARTVALCKLAISMGAGLEGAAHSHCRKALEAGWTSAELMHLAILTTPTIGFPSMMRNRGWVEDVTNAQRSAIVARGSRSKKGQRKR